MTERGLDANGVELQPPSQRPENVAEDAHYDHGHKPPVVHIVAQTLLYGAPVNVF